MKQLFFLFAVILISLVAVSCHEKDPYEIFFDEPGAKYTLPVKGGECDGDPVVKNATQWQLQVSDYRVTSTIEDDGSNKEDYHLPHEWVNVLYNKPTGKLRLIASMNITGEQRLVKVRFITAEDTTIFYLIQKAK